MMVHTMSLMRMQQHLTILWNSRILQIHSQPSTPPSSNPSYQMTMCSSQEENCHNPSLSSHRKVLKNSTYKKSLTPGVVAAASNTSYTGLVMDLNTITGWRDPPSRTAKCWMCGRKKRHQMQPLGSFFPTGFFNATQSCATG